MPAILDWLASLPGRYPDLRLDLLGGLLLATVLGGAIGWERQRAGKPTGPRTNILICLGATLLTDLPVQGSSRPAREVDRRRSTESGAG